MALAGLFWTVSFPDFSITLSASGDIRPADSAIVVNNPLAHQLSHSLVQLIQIPL